MSRKRKSSPDKSGGGKPKTFRINYTFDEYLEVSTNGERSSEAGTSSTKQSDGHYDKSWSGTDTFKEAVDLSRDGWPEGLELMSPIVENLDRCLARSVTVPQCVLDITGDYVDIGTFMTGQPECMMRWEETESTKRVARILFNIAVSGGVSQEAIRWKGATVLALVDRLEAQGIRVELDAVSCLRGYEKDVLELVYNLKKAGDHLSLDRMAFQLVHPAAFRRLGFHALECCSDEICKKIGIVPGGNYGFPREVNKANFPDYDLIIPELHLSTVAESVAEIEKMFGAVCNAELVHA